MSVVMFNDIHSSSDAVLISAIYIIYYIVELRSYIAEIFFFMDAQLSQQIYWQYLRTMILRTQQMNSGLLKPAYKCDFWSQEKRICLLDGNIGNTITFVLATPPPEKVGRIRIEWFQGFSYSDVSPWEKNKTHQINPKDPPWNMVIGSKGHELRISPITETDINTNYFTAIAHFERGKTTRRLHFVIQVMPTDIGLVYPGDTVTIHMPSYVSLPAESMTYKWNLEREPPSLSSNMRPSRSGASLTISELRTEQEGILLCRVFTNLGLFATEKRFLIRNVESENSRLIFTPTRPPHLFIPLAEWNTKLAALLEAIPRLFPKFEGKRDSRNLPNDTDQLDMQRLHKTPVLKKYLTENYNLTIKRKKRSLQTLEWNAKLKTLLESISKFGEKRDSRNFINDTNQLDSQDMKKFLSEIPDLKKYLTESYNLTTKRKKRSLPPEDSLDYLIEPMNDQQIDAGVIPDYNLPEQSELPYITRNLNKRQDDEAKETDEDVDSPMIVARKMYDPNEPETVKPTHGYFGDFDYSEDVNFELEALNLETPPPQPTQQSKPLSFLERHRQAILSRLYSSKPKGKQAKILKSRFRLTTEAPEDEGTLPPLQERDIIAMLLSECERNSQCSLNAECVKRKKSRPGYCRCRPQFEGNGIFCWENDKYKK